MAGNLPGVECARRRRFHQSGVWSDTPSFMPPHTSTRRSSFCLYTSNHESLSSSSLLQRSLTYQAYPHEMLEGAAGEAKQRLDARLGTQRKTEIKREKVRSEAELQKEVYGAKKNGSRRFSWSKLRWKASEQEDCAVCLESFKNGDTLSNLPCAHRFHSRCLEPWLENNSHCPCCRTTIIVSH
ncbi:probable E3 ubiquitin-protein ligase RHY1A isoform X2 [Prosopis cineraria]|uniref:probable E3 ubiquitin-protein ligase RHY1A isoform X2 n=1 Tax=Prosopis cineraria TaxID=364024 RepID=UPI00240FE565|nr:probable E3 ubiquitin-protein ligase RHY1A isoform X2 [Prosopis cineraria]